MALQDDSDDGEIERTVDAIRDVLADRHGAHASRLVASEGVDVMALIRSICADLVGTGGARDVVVITGSRSSLAALSGTLLGPSGAPDPYMVVVARTRVFGFTRDDKASIPGFLSRWTANEGGSPAECVVCLVSDQAVPGALCSGCCASTCARCLPNVARRAYVDARTVNAIACPACRKPCVVGDIFKRPQTPANACACAAPVNLWTALRDAIAGGERFALLVVGCDQVPIVAPVRLDGPRVVIVDSPRRLREILRKLREPGTIVGVGNLPGERRAFDDGQPGAFLDARGVFVAHPRSAAFEVVGRPSANKRGGPSAFAIPFGWEYCCSALI
jgi:hypothetical protein